MSIGLKLKAIRELRGWTQEKVALKADISQPHLSQIERGRIPKPHLSTVRDILSALGVNSEAVLKALLAEMDEETFVEACKENSQFL